MRAVTWPLAGATRRWPWSGAAQCTALAAGRSPAVPRQAAARGRDTVTAGTRVRPVVRRSCGQCEDCAGLPAAVRRRPASGRETAVGQRPGRGRATGFSLWPEAGCGQARAGGPRGERSPPHAHQRLTEHWDPRFTCDLCPGGRAASQRLGTATCPTPAQRGLEVS